MRTPSFHQPARRTNHQLLLFLTLTLLLTTLPISPSRATPATAPTKLAVASSSPDSWSSAGNMSVERTEHTATLLKNGKVLITGGATFGTVTDSSEIYDPISNSWSPAASMSLPRSRHTATRLNNGKVLVAGGLTGAGFPTTAELYDPLTNTWAPAGNTSTGRIYASATLLTSGKVLVTGGYSETALLKSAELYDPNTNSWSPAAPRNALYGIAPATLLGNGKILVEGGVDGNGAITTTSELYDPAIDSWSIVASMQDPLKTNAAILLSNGQVLALGDMPNPGQQAPHELYDPLTNQWLPVPTATFTRQWPSLTPLGNGMILVAGGYNWNSPFQAPTQRSAELYNPATNSWTPAPDMNEQRGGHTATLLGNGKVLVVGGVPFQTTSFQVGAAKSAELYTPACSTKAGATCDTTLSLSVAGPDALAVANGQYTPNPFTITGVVRNDGAATATNVRVTLYLPHGLELAVGDITQIVGDIPAGEVRNLAWSVRGTGVSEDATLKYFLAAAASNAVALPAEGQIGMPGLLSVAAVTPNKGGNTGRVTVDIQGSGFKEGATVHLGSVVGQNTSVISSEWLTTTFDLRNQSPGTAQIEVANLDGATTAAPEPFTIVSGGEGQLEIDLVGPAFVRVGTHESLTRVPFYRLIRNTGLIDVDPVITLIFAEDTDTSLSGTRNSSLRLEYQTLPLNTVTSQAVFAQNSENIPSGSMNISQMSWSGNAKECVALTLTTLDCDTLGKIFLTLTALVDQNDNDLRASTARLNNPIYNCGKANELPECAMIRAHIEVLRNIISDQRVLLRELCKNWPATKCPKPALCIGFENDPLPPGFTATARGWLNTLLQAVIKSILKSCPIGSADPNDIYGPAGVGDARYVRGDSPLSYNIVFENKPEATAAAQEVVVTDSLDLSKVDPSTFSLGPIAFGAMQITPPPGLKQFSTDVDLRPSMNLIARVNAGLNEATGLITWRFSSLDPATMLPTTDVLAGFLPPNKTAPEGDGSVFYTISPKPGLATGTEIRAKATIVFDMNPPIDTPEWRNTIDATQPTSHVQPLIDKHRSAGFPVQWSGSDAAAGIQDYTIYVSEDGGPYTIWLANTTATSGTFVGRGGKMYSFYSVARDQVGNMEDADQSADATTSILQLAHLALIQR
jgi:hypothetical protein